MNATKFKMGEKVKVIAYPIRPRWVGLTGVIVWIGANTKPVPIYQIKTEKKPRYYRPANSSCGYIFTVSEDEIEPCV